MTSKLETLATTKFAPQQFIQEGSWGLRTLQGKHESTMTLYRWTGGTPFIEWDIPGLNEVEHIGLELEGKRVVGYDGVMSFPRPAYKWLRSLGYTIARDVI